jgi:hypothetical protein
MKYYYSYCRRRIIGCSFPNRRPANCSYEMQMQRLHTFENMKTFFHDAVLIVFVSSRSRRVPAGRAWGGSVVPTSTGTANTITWRWEVSFWYRTEKSMSEGTERFMNNATALETGQELISFSVSLRAQHWLSLTERFSRLVEVNGTSRRIERHQILMREKHFDHGGSLELGTPSFRPLSLLWPLSTCTVSVRLRNVGSRIFFTESFDLVIVSFRIGTLGAFCFISVWMGGCERSTIVWETIGCFFMSFPSMHSLRQRALRHRGALEIPSRL